MVYAIGAGAQVLAVDDQSNYPPEVLDKPHDLSGYQPNVEAIAALKPDLVLIGDDTSGLSKQLDSLGLATWVGLAATSFDGVYDQIEQLGALTGHVGDAAALVSKMQTDIDAAVKAAPKPAQPLTYYHELDNTYYSVTENTFIGAGLLAVRHAQHRRPPGGLQRLPAAVGRGDHLGQTPTSSSSPTAASASRPRRSPHGRAGPTLKAVTNGNVVVVDADISSRWGPRIVDYIKDISAERSSKAVAAG